MAMERIVHRVKVGSMAYVNGGAVLYLSFKKIKHRW